MILLASETAPTPPRTPSNADSLSAAWSEEPSIAEDGLVLYHALSASSLIAPEGAATPTVEACNADVEPSGKETLEAALDLLIVLFGAERAFLFEAAEAEAGESRLVETCVASRDLDGEEVRQPDEKVPWPFLREAVGKAGPVLGDPETSPGTTGTSPAEEPAARRSLCLPVQWGEKLLGLLYVENRFRPLKVSRETLRLAEVHCRVLATLLELKRVQEENRSLWCDLARLRETNPLEEKLARTRSHLPPRHTKLLKRSDLKGDYSMIIGSSSQMIEMFQVIDRISSSGAPVLITGESGTGKELIAQAIHHNSPRHEKVFVSENCGALTETLLESELFGYVKGAFTGANRDHKGLFELAVGGTLFLDEVGDMSPSMQKKLLRVLQEGVIRRVGGKDFIPVDARIISATNKDLQEEVRTGNFREDLYYRLNVIHLKLPPLRDRREDIPELVESFLANLGREAGVTKGIDPLALERLADHGWPGNIRELQNEVRRMFALSEGDIRVQDLSDSILQGEKQDFAFKDFERELGRLTLREATERLEKEMIRNALVQCRGNKSLVAKMLQVPKTSLYNKINKYDMEKG